MELTTVVVLLAIVVLIGFAIYLKPHVRAWGRFRFGEFYIEAADHPAPQRVQSEFMDRASEALERNPRSGIGEP